MSFEILDPTHETDAATFAPAPRPDALAGATIGVISNGKQGTRRFFDALAAEFIDTYGAVKVERVTKSNYSAPADQDILDRAKEWNALVAGVGD